MLQFRPAQPDDLPALLAVHRAAFGPAEGPVIAELVAALLADPTAAPSLSLLALQENAIVGHVLLTAARLEPSTHHTAAQLLAPLAVLPTHQRQGVGTQLAQAALRQAAAAGVDLVFVLGHPAYYPRLGFQPAGAWGLEATYPIAPHNAPAWMVLELTPGTLGAVRGRVACAAALDQERYWVE